MASVEDTELGGVELVLQELMRGANAPTLFLLWLFIPSFCPGFSQRWSLGFLP